PVRLEFLGHTLVGICQRAFDKIDIARLQALGPRELGTSTEPEPRHHTRDQLGCCLKIAARPAGDATLAVYELLCCSASQEDIELVLAIVARQIGALVGYRNNES